MRLEMRRNRLTTAPPLSSTFATIRERGEDTLPFALGQAQFVNVKPAVWVANLIGQQGLRRRGGVPPVRYEAIRQGLARVAAFALEQNAAVQMPRIGCGLAGGKWEEVEPLVQQELADKGVTVTVYDLPSNDRLRL